ncbi:MAG: hypothetical protein JST22_12685 [Bacteroidetes bacterium]|nr:hypothetical protein [Bacteroidota bacterium]
MARLFIQCAGVLLLGSLLVAGRTILGTEAQPRHGRLLEKTNGLAIELPDSLFAEEIDNGFIVSAQGPKDFRYPEEVEIVGAKPGEMQHPSKAACRTVGNATMYYRYDVIPIGYGHRHRLTAWFEQNGRVVRLQQIDRNQCTGAPRFDLLWEIAPHVAVRAAERRS